MEIEAICCGKIIYIGDGENIVFRGDWFICPHCKTWIRIEFHTLSTDTIMEVENQIPARKTKYA